MHGTIKKDQFRHEIFTGCILEVYVYMSINISLIIAPKWSINMAYHGLWDLMML